MFCKKCGSILFPKKGLHVCSCGYRQKAEKAELKEIVKPKRGVDVVVKENMEHLPLIDEECPKCGHKKARYWLVQTRAGDEPETKFFRCEKCGHTWRDYG